MSQNSIVKLVTIALLLFWTAELVAQPEALAIGAVEPVKAIEFSVKGPIQDATSGIREISFEDSEMLSFSIHFNEMNIPK